MPGSGGKLHAITKLLSPTAGARILLVTAVGYILSSLLGYAKGGVAVDHSFGMIKSIRGTPPFSDFLWVVIVGQCGTRSERLPHSISSICATYGYGQPGGGYEATGYPPLADYLVKIIDVPARHSGAISLLVGILFVIAIILSSRRLFRFHWSWPLWLSVALIGFPAQLLLERGNIDSIIYLLMVGASALICLGGWPGSLLLPLVVYTAIALKAFPVLGFVGWLVSASAINPKDYPISKFVKASVGLGCGIGIASLAPWAFSTGIDIQFSGGLNSFGLKAIGYINTYLVSTAGFEYGRLLIWMLIVLKLVSVVTPVILAVRASLDETVFGFLRSVDNPSFRKYSETYFLLMTWTWLGCYLLTISYDYKHIFILPSFLLFCAMLENHTLMTRLQRGIVLTLVTGALFVLLMPLFVHAQWHLLTKDTTIKLLELFGEMVVIPFYAGSLLAILGLPLLRSVSGTRFARIGSST